MKLKHWLIGSALAFSASFAHAKVWEDTNTWNETYETKFSEWIRTLPLDFFTNSSSGWSGIATDCADAAYTLRIIFAYENKLPVQFQNGANDLDNRTSFFDTEQDEMKRVRRFISRVKYYTNTITIADDTYPIEINRKYLKAGAMFVHPQTIFKKGTRIDAYLNKETGIPDVHLSGHVYYIEDVLANGTIVYMSSTVPVMVRNLAPRWGIHYAPFFNEPRKQSGYRRWKWPHTDARPGMSQEQFQIGGWKPYQYDNEKLKVSWQKAIEDRLRTTAPASLRERIDYAAKNVRYSVLERSFLVQEAWSLFQRKYVKQADANGRVCMSKAEQDDYSTPSRDTKIQYELTLMKSAIRKYLEAEQSWDPCPGTDLEKGSLACFNEGRNQFFRKYTVQIIPPRKGKEGMTVNYEYLQKLFNQGVTALWISEPEHSPEMRWGLKEPQSSADCPCPQAMRGYRGSELLPSFCK